MGVIKKKIKSWTESEDRDVIASSENPKVL